MLRPASSRNQRAKGFRLKHALQIGILVAICIWLLYQVKHSHDKKRAYDARNLKMATKAIENQEDFFNFGRKDLTRTEEAATANMDHKEEESEETQEEEEEPEIKQEEEEPEIQQQETEDEEVRGAGDDAIDDQDKENNDDEAEDAEHVEDPIEEDDKEGQMEETDQSDSQDHEGGTRAREENYKRDDVSSAVVHDTRATESEAFPINAKGSDEEQTSDGSKVDNDSTSDGSKVGVAEDNMEEQEIETENMVNGTADGSKVDNVTTDGSTKDNLSDAMKDNSTMPDGNLANNGTAADSALMSSSTRVEDTSQTNSLTNNTTEAESNDEMELSANSTSISVNQTEGQNNSTVDELPTDVQTSNGTVILASARDQNTTVDEGAQGEVESNLENIVDREEKSNSRTVLDSGEQSTTSSATNRNIVNRAGLGETNDKSHEVIEEGRETRTYLSTLPSIKHEAT